MIKDTTLDQTILECLRTARALQALRTARRTRNNRYGWEVKEHAAAMRASMDLTRKLADMRQGR